MGRTTTAILVVAVLVGGIGATWRACPAAALADEEPDRPAAPQAWLEAYAETEVTSEAYDRLRERLFRAEDDADVVRGLVWLRHARDPQLRRSVGKPLANAYLLGAEIGQDAADEVLAAVRGLARDPDARARYHTLSALFMHDTPLAREVALAHARREIETPDGPEWRRVREKFDGFLVGHLDPDEPDQLRALLKGDDDTVRMRWIDAAAEAPATANEGRWQAIEVERGVPRDVALPRLEPGDPECVLAVSLSTANVARNEDPAIPTSIDNVFVQLTRAPSVGGGGSGIGGDGLYLNGISGMGEIWFDQLVRYLGDAKVRVWVRRRPPEANPPKLVR